LTESTTIRDRGTSNEEASLEDLREGRQYLKYSFFKLLPTWRSATPLERQDAKLAFSDLIEKYAKKIILKSFSLLGTRGDCDFMLWSISERLEDFQEMISEIMQSGLGCYLTTPYSYLSMTRRSEYIREHRHPGQEGDALKKIPGNAKYLFVYPFVKKREWYSLAPEERQRMMMEHIRKGHRFPSVKINTSYSFGLDDQEFVLSFETDYPSDFLELVMSLRSSEVSSYTELEVPIFACISSPVNELLGLL
jgi:chlorite dismutase